eukprot:5036724-Alexandrium_andersonii.AAC.1
MRRQRRLASRRMLALVIRPFGRISSPASRRAGSRPAAAAARSLAASSSMSSRNLRLDASSTSTLPSGALAVAAATRGLELRPWSLMLKS